MSSIIQNPDGTYIERRGEVTPSVNPNSVCGQVEQVQMPSPEQIADSEGE